jgi:Icc-related predicted phosphoesterase
MLGRNKQPRNATGPRIVFATDIHGSEDCFRKFLNSARVYDATILILGGDILGKRIVPIVREPDGTYSCTYGEDSVSGLDKQGLAELKRKIRRFGDYWVVGSSDDLTGLNDPEESDRMFRAAVLQSMTDWVTLADERLKGGPIRCLVAPGNDDFLDIDPALQGSECLEFAENRCIAIDDKYDVITTGYSNLTPWETERELPEDELQERIEGMARKARSTTNMILVAHPPPYDCGLDQAPALDEEFAMKISAGVGIEMAPVGSTAVRTFIEERQPLLGLHGHVHESAGAIHIGRTLCINPGSLYGRGVLNAAIVQLGDGEVLSHQFISG